MPALVSPSLTLVSPPMRISVPDARVLFLAGPIQGAVDWQREAVQRLHRMRGTRALVVANPRRSRAHDGEFDDDLYNEQVDWEHYYLDLAVGRGCVLFWLAREHEHRCDRAYAQTTRFELGEHFAYHRLLARSGVDVKLVVGIEDGYTGARYVRRTLAKKAPGVPVYDNLRATCMAAVRAVTGRPTRASDLRRRR